MNSVSESIAQSIVFLENVVDVWTDLKERFSQGDFVRISELQQEIYSLRQDSRSVTEFFSALKILWEELELYLPIPTCTCPVKCSCEAMRSARNNHNLLYVIRFLTGLNDNFDMVKSQILLMDPLPPLNKIFSMVIQHERQGGSHPSDDSKALINFVDSKKNASKPSRSGSNPSGSKRMCSFCGKDNHIVDNCYKKHGLPPHLQKKSQSNHAALEGSECDDESIAASDSKANGSTSATAHITQAQYDRLVQLLQSSSLNQGSTLASSNQVGSSKFTGHPSVNTQGNFLSHINNCALGAWIIDSGASHHICTSLTWFHSYNEITPISVRLPNGNSVHAKYSGIVRFPHGLELRNVLCIPDFSINLLSVSSLCHYSNCNVLLNGMHCSIQEQRTMRMIGSAEVFDGLYYLNHKSKTVYASAIDKPNTFTIPNNALWHFRLGHLSQTRMNLLITQFPFIVVDQKGICDVCHFARHNKLSYAHSFNKASKPFELIHFDIWCPLAVKSVNGFSYFLTDVDDYTRYTWITLMKTKAEARQNVVNFIQLIENQYNSKVKIVRSDNGPEFLMPNFYNSKGIIHQTSCVESPQQNGRVERKHQHILNVGRALLYQSNLPISFWSYAVVHAVFIINKIPTPLLQNRSPHELMHGALPDLQILKVFGSLVYASTLQNNRTKLDPRGRKCIFLGYKQGVKGTILFDLNTKDIFISRNVTHYEHILPYQSNSSKFTWHYHSPPPTDHICPPLDQPNNHLTPSSPIIPNSTTVSQHDTPSPLVSNSTPASLNETPSPLVSDSTPNSPTHTTNTSVLPPTRPIRQKHTPSYLSDYVYNSSLNSLEASSSGTLYPISAFHSFAHLSPLHSSFTAAITH
jgi:hypothetical protein